MKVFVVYERFQWEGCSEPLAAFSTIEKAERWADEFVGCGYVEELEIDELGKEL